MPKGVGRAGTKAPGKGSGREASQEMLARRAKEKVGPGKDGLRQEGKERGVGQGDTSANMG